MYTGTVALPEGFLSPQLGKLSELFNSVRNSCLSKILTVFKENVALPEGLLSPQLGKLSELFKVYGTAA